MLRVDRAFVGFVCVRYARENVNNREICSEKITLVFTAVYDFTFCSPFKCCRVQLDHTVFEKIPEEQSNYTAITFVKILLDAHCTRELARRVGR